MADIHLLSPEEWERPEMKKLKELISKMKPVMDRDSRHRAYVSISEMNKLFPSRKYGDRYDESIISNIKKYIHHFNKNYCQDGCYYKSGIAWSKNGGEKVIFVEEVERDENIDDKVKILSAADITDTQEKDKDGNKVRIGNTKIDINQLPDKMKEKLSEELDKEIQ